MRTRPLSDLHFEFHADLGKEFIARQDPRGVDLLVLSGDITHAHLSAEMFERFRKKFSCPIVFVPGNHEYHKSSRGPATRALRGAVDRLRGVHWLDNEVIEIEGQRVLGTTLWYGPPEVPIHPLLLSTREEWQRGFIRMKESAGSDKVIEDVFADFKFISGLRSWVYDEHERSMAFLRENLRAGDIVMSHFLPSRCSVTTEWQERLNTGFFVTDVHALIEERKPALWIHGHTHESLDYQIGPTRVICNPLGYKKEINPRFDESLIVSVSADAPTQVASSSAC